MDATLASSGQPVRRSGFPSEPPGLPHDPALGRRTAPV